MGALSWGWGCRRAGAGDQSGVCNSVCRINCFGVMLEEWEGGLSCLEGK